MNDFGRTIPHQCGTLPSPGNWARGRGGEYIMTTEQNDGCTKCLTLQRRIITLETEADLLNDRTQRDAATIDDLRQRLVEEEALHRALTDRLT